MHISIYFFLFFFTEYNSEQLANIEQNYWLQKVPKMYLWKLKHLAGKMNIFDREQRSKVLEEALLLLFFLAWKHE